MQSGDMMVKNASRHQQQRSRSHNTHHLDDDWQSSHEETAEALSER
jgi:hypothetical protein